jgi:dTDP-4-amino-4,6-dideoxygalactose transaminase
MAEYKGRKVGTMGIASTFSFYPSKNLGAMGDGGCLVTNDSKLAHWCDMYARHGGKGEHHIEGINSRLDGLQAAILSVKLPHLETWTTRRQRVARVYTEKLSGIESVCPPVIGGGRTHVFHLYVIRTSKRDELREHLEGAGVATALNYPKALPFYPAYAYLNHTPADFPNAFANQNRILSLPIFPELSEEAVGYVVERIKEFHSA